MSDDDKKALRGEVIETQVIHDNTSSRDEKYDEHVRLDADEFVLGVGTPVEQSIRWPNGIPISPWFKHTDEHLRRLRNFFEGAPVRKNNVCLVDGIWLVWCYASMDVKNLYTQIGALNDRILDLEAKIEALEGRLNGDFMLGGV